ncbi:MAG TPA: phage holin family protein [Gammaproteobacteria bacterium]|nr:phage holin family protein [Gammaproteobacteria bacterium]
MIVHFLLLGAVIFALAEILPGLHVEGYGTALVVAVVYGLINVTLGTVLMFFALPFMILTVGLFKLVINTFLLWITDQLIEDFEIEDLGTTFIAAILITLSDTMLAWMF